MSDAKLAKQRIFIIALLVGFAGLLIVSRLFSLQIVNGSRYRARAERQYVTPTNQLFDRGSIYFTARDGSTIAAATIESGFKVEMVPARVLDPELTYNSLSGIISVDRDSFFASVAKKHDPSEPVARRISGEQADQIASLGLPGLVISSDPWRMYPGGSLAAKAIGFVSYRENTLVGTYGLEKYYNDVLSRNTKELYVNFFAEIFANIQSTIFNNKSTVGDIVTSIEPAVQTELERAVAGIQQKWGSESVGAIVVDPQTGEIVAMAHVPTFDLNNYGAETDVSVYSNPFAQSVYEMGSIVKPLVMAAAIDVGAVTADTTYNDAGSIAVGDRVLSNFDKVGRGKASMQDVLSQSLNTGMVYAQQKMGKEKFREYMLDKYKLGEKTGVDLPGEVNGIVGNLRGSNDVNYATASFGQGVATTPLNIVRGFMMLANGGTLVTPHLVTHIEGDNGIEKIPEYPRTPGVLKPETIATMGSMLTKVVDDGYKLGHKNYTVAAKTGTAQIARPGGGGYYDDRNLHSLIGYFPVSNPRFVVYFYNVHPKGARYAIQTLSDPFFGMIQFLGNYYDINPDR